MGRGVKELQSKEITERFLHCPPPLREQMEHCHFAAGEYLMRCGDEADTVYLLLEGDVKVFHYAQNGEIIISYIGSKNRELFGEVEALRDDGYAISRNVLAVTACSAMKIPKALFLQWVRQDPDWSLFLLRRFARQMAEASEYGVSSAVRPLKVRAAMLLLDHLQPGGEVNIGKDELSGILATSMRSTNRILKTMREERLIAVRGNHLKVLNEEALQQLVQESEE